MATEKKYKYTFKKDEQGEIKVTVVVEPSLLDEAREMEYKRQSPQVKLPGFRPGKAPRAQIEAKIANSVFTEAIRNVLTNLAAEIIQIENFNPVSKLDYDVTKASNSDGLHFEFSFANYPEIKLKLNNLKIKLNHKPVTDTDIDSVINNLFNQSGKQEPDVKQLTDKDVEALEIPDLKTVANLRDEVRKRLQDIHHEQAHGEALEKLVQTAISQSSIPVPSTLVKDTAEQLVERYTKKIAELKIDLDQFLSAQGKTIEQIRQDKEAEAKQQVQRELLYMQLAKDYDLIPTSDDIDAELAGIEDPEIKAQYDTYEGRRHMVSIVIQRRAIAKLQELAKWEETEEKQDHQEPAAKKKSRDKKS